MESIRSGEHPTADSEEVNATAHEGPGNRAETIGRLSLSFPGERPSLALLEAIETRADLMDKAFEDGNIAD
jgi:hypothetical protein